MPFPFETLLPSVATSYMLKMLCEIVEEFETQVVKPRKGMTKVERILNRMKNHPVIGIFIVIGIVIISLARFTDALQRLYSFFVGSKKPQAIQSIARFPLDLQMSRAKERIRYLSQEYLKTDTMSLVEVVGAYGDNVLDSPQLYDWNKVMDELEKQGYIRILSRAENNIEFKVLTKK